MFYTKQLVADRQRQRLRNVYWHDQAKDGQAGEGRHPARFRQTKESFADKVAGW